MALLRNSKEIFEGAQSLLGRLQFLTKDIEDERERLKRQMQLLAAAQMILNLEAQDFINTQAQRQTHVPVDEEYHDGA